MKKTGIYGNSTMTTAALKVARAIRQSGENEIKIVFLTTEVHVSGILGEEFDWGVSEKVSKITDKPPITWGVRKTDEDDLVIYLKNGEDEIVEDSKN